MCDDGYEAHYDSDLHAGLSEHDGYEPHSHEVRADHFGVAKVYRGWKMTTAPDGKVSVLAPSEGALLVTRDNEADAREFVDIWTTENADPSGLRGMIGGVLDDADTVHAFPFADELWLDQPIAGQHDGLMAFLEARGWNRVTRRLGPEGEAEGRCKLHGEPMHPSGKTSACNGCQAGTDPGAGHYALDEFPGGYGTARVEYWANGSVRAALVGAEAYPSGYSLDWGATFDQATPAAAVLAAVATAFRNADEGK